MKLWIDAQISPAIAAWINQHYGIDAIAVRDLSLREAEDLEIFFAAKRASAVVMTKDSDFLLLLDQHGPPPQVIWLTCGNTSNARLKQILTNALSEAINLINNGERLVEIGAF
jgi:predicted nuclease of predicted toxin-antitoxin system